MEDDERERAAIERLLQRVHARDMRALHALGEPGGGGGNDGDGQGGGMKRGRDDPPRQPFVWPAHFPDDVLCELVLQGFDWRLASLLEYSELHQMRQVSQRFARVIDQCVVRQIRELGDDVMESMGAPQLLQFASLQSLLRVIPSEFDWQNELEAALEVMRALKAVRRVDLRFHGLTHPELQPDVMRALGHVEALSLYGLASTELPTQLRSLTLERSSFDDDDALLRLSALQTLVVRGNPYSQFDRMSGLLSLHTLVVQQYRPLRLDLLPRLDLLRRVWIEGRRVDAGHNQDVALLSGVEALALVGWTDVSDATLGRLTTLRSLYVRVPANRLTIDSVSRLTDLRSLAINGNRYMEPRHTDAWPRLSWLSLYKSHPSARVLAALTRLVYLDLSHCAMDRDAARALRGMHNLQTLLLRHAYGFRVGHLPRSLTTLALDSTRIVENAALGHLTDLTTLSLVYNERITDSGVIPLLALRQLDLTHNRLVSEYACSDLPALQLLAASHSLLYDEYESYVGDSLRFRFAFKARRCVVTSGRVDIRTDWRAMPEWSELAPSIEEQNSAPHPQFEDFVAPSSAL